MSRFFYLQLESPTKGDWGSTCIKDLKELNIPESLEEIKLMTNSKFKNLIKERVKKNAFEYLMNKQGSKGKHTDLSMAEYLLPTNKILSINEKQEIFHTNFPKPNE